MDKQEKARFIAPLFQFLPFWINMPEALVESLYSYAVKFSKKEEREQLTNSLNDIQTRLAAIDAA